MRENTKKILKIISACSSAVMLAVYFIIVYGIWQKEYDGFHFIIYCALLFALAIMKKPPLPIIIIIDSCLFIGDLVELINMFEFETCIFFICATLVWGLMSFGGYLKLNDGWFVKKVEVKK